MSTVIRSLMVKVGADFTDMQKGMAQTSKSLKSMGKQITAAGSKLTTSITLPIIGAAAASIKFASDLEESTNKVNVAFKDSAAGVKDWSNTTLKSFGIAKGTALDMAALFGDMSTSMGLTTDEAADMSKSLVGLAGDLASFKNIGIEEAETALKAIFTGETESLKNLGIVMTQANLDAYALANGFNKTTKQMTQAEQVQLRYAYVMAMTKNAQGDFARTSDGTANQLRIMQESFKELAATLGQNLLPIITPILETINGWVQSFANLDKGTQEMIVKIALMAAVIGPLLLVFGKVAMLISGVVGAMSMLKTATMVQTVATYGLNAALLANPITWIVLVIAALVTAFVLLWKNCEGFRNFWIGLWDTIKNITKTVVGVLIDIFLNFTPQGLIIKHWSSITAFFKNLWGGVLDIFRNAVNGIIKVVNLIPGINIPLLGTSTGTYGPAGPADTMSGDHLAEYAIGTDYVPSTGLALLHKGEAVIPADKNNGGYSGGTINHTGVITVLGVNDAGQTVGSAKIIAENLKRDSRRYPSGVSFTAIGG